MRRKNFRVIGVIGVIGGVIGAIPYKRLSIFYLQLNYSLSVALKRPPLPLSNIFTQTPQVIYHCKWQNQGGNAAV